MTEPKPDVWVVLHGDEPVAVKPTYERAQRCTVDPSERIARYTPSDSSAAERLARLESALRFLKGGRSPDVYIERALEMGWRDPAAKDGG